MKKPDGGLYLLLVSPHGLVRGHNLELGRNADTGGQIKYVIELAHALIKRPEVERVDLLTRLIVDKKVSVDYSMPLEEVTSGFNIVRIPCGPWRYFKKESLWPYIENFADNVIKYLRYIGRAPDLIHAHYADGGYIGAGLTGLLGVPMVFTGHSLGRVKRQRLIDHGVKIESIENIYHVGRRIEAEERALDNAALVIASTEQEVREQYAVYDNYRPKRMMVIPPGVNIKKFTPPSCEATKTAKICEDISRFLNDPSKPMILALSRADARKNIGALVEAYATNPRLVKMANLVLVMGSRESIRSMDKASRNVMTDIVMMIDKYDLYGSVAYPKRHLADDVAEIYKMAARTGGLFVNPALTEPFGLTILESAASGLPVIATENGGARDIVNKLKNGMLIDPLNVKGIGETLERALSDKKRLKKWAQNGVAGVRRHYSWGHHAKKYLQAVEKIITLSEPQRIGPRVKGKLVTTDRVLVCDIDNTLIGDKDALGALLEILDKNEKNIGFGVASGRSLELVLDILKEWNIPIPNLLITDVGGSIFYGPTLREDQGWLRHISHRWNPDAIKEEMKKIKGLKPQPKEGQGLHKISYFVDPGKTPGMREITKTLRRAGLYAKVIYSHKAYLDIVPIRASKGMAIRYFAVKWGIPIENFLVAGDSGNDEDMLTGNTLAVVVGNHSQELNKLRGKPQIYFADGHHAWGIIEAIEHYDFLGSVHPHLTEGASL